MNIQYFLGMDLFTWEDWDEIDSGMLKFYNVEFPFESMKQFNGNSVVFQLEGTLTIYSEYNNKLLWEGFPTEIEEFKEMLLESVQNMKNFNWEEFEKGKIFIHFDTNIECKDFIEQCHIRDLIWSDGNNILEYYKSINKFFDRDYLYYEKVKKGINVVSNPFYIDDNIKIIKWKIDNQNETIDNQNNNLESVGTKKYIIYGEGRKLNLELNEPQVKLLNLLINEGTINEVDVIDLDKIKYQTI